MKKRLLISLWLLLALVLPRTPAQAAKTDKPIYSRLTFPLFFEQQIPDDIEQVNDALNAITRKKIGAEITLIPLLRYSSYNTDQLRQTELELLQKQGVEFDLSNTSYLNATPLPLDVLLEKYGQGIVARVGANTLNLLREADGRLYVLPSVTNYLATQGIAMRRDILEKYEIDASQIRSLEDLDALYQYLHEREPELKLVCGYRTGQAIFSRGANTNLVQSTVFCQSREDPTLLVNYYATEEYREIVRFARKWHLAGYFPENIAFQNLSASSLVQAGELFSFFAATSPNSHLEVNLNCGMEMVIIPLTENVVMPYLLVLHAWSIPNTCTNPGKALQFLNLLYTDSEVVNLLLYGLEGIHYALQEDGTIDYPQGETKKTVGYSNSDSSLLPNILVAHRWSGIAPELWEQPEAPVAEMDLTSFRFDGNSVSAEIIRINAVVDRYYYGLGSGQLGPEFYLPQMLNQMNAAGLAAIQVEIQEQFSKWLDTKE